MCGIAAFSGSKMDPMKMKVLLLLNEPRGKDSSGFYHNGRIQKEIGPISKTIHKYEFDEETDLFIGHTRAKTFGAVSIGNQHPFEFRNIIGVHNGSLTNKFELERLYGLERNEVDSQTLIACLAKTQDANVFKDLEGAAAVVWTDTSDESNPLYIARNSERPLHRGKIKDEGTYFSSEKEPLMAIGCTDINEIKTERLYKFINGTVTEHVPLKMKSTGKKSQARTANTCTADITKTGTNSTKHEIILFPHKTTSNNLIKDLLYSTNRIYESTERKVPLIHGDKMVQLPSKSIYPAVNHDTLKLAESKFYRLNKDVQKFIEEEGCSISRIKIPKGTIVKSISIDYNNEYVPLIQVLGIEDYFYVTELENINLEEIDDSDNMFSPITNSFITYKEFKKNMSIGKQSNINFNMEKTEEFDDEPGPFEGFLIDGEAVMQSLEEIESNFTEFKEFLEKNLIKDSFSQMLQQSYQNRLSDLESVINELRKTIEDENARIEL